MDKETEKRLGVVKFKDGHEEEILTCKMWYDETPYSRLAMGIVFATTISGEYVSREVWRGGDYGGKEHVYYKLHTYDAMLWGEPMYEPTDEIEYIDIQSNMIHYFIGRKRNK